MQIKDTRPQGSPAELEEAGLSLAEFGSCAKAVPGEVIGCSRWGICSMSYKGQGPRNHKCRIVKPEALGRGVREVAMTCYVALEQQAQWKARGGALQIVGGEGSKYLIRGSRIKVQRDAKGVELRDEATGRTIPIVGLDGKSPSHYEDFIGEETVAAFIRPGMNKDLLKAAYEARVLKEAQERQEADQVNRALDIPNRTHADQVNADKVDEPTPARRTASGGSTRSG